MKLTPLDIHHKEFRLALRGYNQEEVDSFLDEVADEFERLFKENIDLSEKLDAANEKVRGYAEIEKTLHNTMLAAQRSSEEIKAKADKDAELLMRDAEIKAKELVQGALSEKQRTQSEFMRIKAAEDDFRLKFRAVLEDYMRGLHAVPVEADIAALVGITEEKVPELKVAAERVVAAPDAEPEMDPAQAPALMVDPVEPAPVVAEDAPARPRAQVAPRAEGTQPIVMDPPSTGFVQSLTLGEVEGPDVRPDTPEFEEPSEFAVPARGAVGERDDDLDIEEID
ncbi:MAG: DivIVA domain-containing protein [Coriobacteriia bacterium]|nr:DivIVA domain-containing protein [Coriobacteriia bacterium]